MSNKLKRQPNTSYQGVVCKAQIGRNTLSYLQYFKGTNPYDKNPTIHHIINARSMSIVPNLRPL
jgi:hypothetical protein